MLKIEKIITIDGDEVLALYRVCDVAFRRIKGTETHTIAEQFSEQEVADMLTMIDGILRR